MGLSNYTELQASMASWLNRGDLTASIPDFITLCEADLRKNLKAKGTRVIGSLGILSANGGTEVLPTGVKSLEHLSLDTLASDGRVEITTPDRVMYWRTAIAGAGIPRWAALVNDTILVAPLPDTDYSGTMIYDAELTPLSGTVATNWLLTNHPDAYLYGSLIHSAPFLKNDERLTIWKGLYDDAIAKLEVTRAEAEFGANAPVGMPRRSF